MDRFSKEQRSDVMRSIKSKNSKIELILSKKLWSMGVRYRKNDRNIFGNPDISFKRIKIAIFVDSEFWHGKDWENNKHKIRSNQTYWYPKIERNIERDKNVNDTLLKQGWKVLRFWGKEIEGNLDLCINNIIQEVTERRKSIQKNSKH